MAQIHWNRNSGGDFNTGTNWTGGHVPGAADDVTIADQLKPAFTVTDAANQTVNSLQTAANATLHIGVGYSNTYFTMTNGTGAGANAGTIFIGDTSIVTMGGTINNSGAIVLAPAGDSAQLRFGGAGAVTLTGGGQVTMTGNGRDSIVDYGATSVTNFNNIISGAGYFDLGISLINAAAGVIDATQVGRLTLSAGGIANAGLIEGTGSGGLYMSVSVFNLGGGRIFAGDGSNVTLNGSTIYGGTLTTAGSGIIETRGVGPDNYAALDGVAAPLTNLGTISTANSSTLTLQGGIINAGKITVDSAGATTRLVIGQKNAGLSGAGLVILSDNAANQIIGYTSGATLTNIDISSPAAGDIGTGQMTLVNQVAGAILGTGNNALIIDTGANTVINAGLIEAESAGGVTIVSAVKNASTGAIAAVGGNLFLQGSVTNAGLIQANLGYAVTISNNATVDGTSGGTLTAANGGRIFLSSATLAGGTLQTTGAGIIEAAGATLDGTTAAVNNQGAFQVDVNGGLTIKGAIHNTGKISLAGTAAAIVVGAAGATLSGGGTVALGNHASNRIFGLTATAILTNVDNTISGAGLLGNHQMTLINQAAGVIKGTSGAAALTLDTGANTIANAGLIQSSGAAGTVIQSAVANTGVLFSSKGTLTVNGAITGAGTAKILAGAIDFTASFSENVAFTGTTGVLELAQSQGYAGTVSGFSKTGGTQLDLRDIAFVSAGEATYVGTTAGGILTVSDGVHTATIALKGDYTASTFIAAGDGHGGVIIHDPTAPASPQAFVAAMAGLGARGGGLEPAAAPATRALVALLSPRPGIA